MVKRSLGLMAFATALCIGLPLAILPDERLQGSSQSEPQTWETIWSQEDSQALAHTTKVDGALGVRVLEDDGTVTEMTLEDYLVGVLLGEMPADFAEEALKAQAVVCRTYTLRRCQAGKHDGADICTDSACCQAWQDMGKYTLGVRERVRQAVNATDGQVLYYHGALIDATFFSSSGGRTEAAVAVWGSNVPYLQAVDSPGEVSPYNEDESRFSLEVFRSIIHAAEPNADLSDTPENWFGAVTQTPGGGVETMTIGGVTFMGTKLRSLFSLRSTAFTVQVADGEVVFHTQGFGHRVGMSQYGAQAMALAGKRYEEILLYYYTGVDLDYYDQNRADE